MYYLNTCGSSLHCSRCTVVQPLFLAPVVAVGPLQAAALLCGTGCLAVRTDLEVDIALDLILALEEVIRGIHFEIAAIRYHHAAAMVASTYMLWLPHNPSGWFLIN